MGHGCPTGPAQSGGQGALVKPIGEEPGAEQGRLQKQGPGPLHEPPAMSRLSEPLRQAVYRTMKDGLREGVCGQPS